MKIQIYTDGSCHTQYKMGAWVAILFIHSTKKILSGVVSDTTHHRMELTAVIKAIDYLFANYTDINHVEFFSDSQYVIDLPKRQKKLEASSFTTKKGNELQNTDLIKQLLTHFAACNIQFVKIKAHQKKNGKNDANIEADILSRKMVRDAVFHLLETTPNK